MLNDKQRMAVDWLVEGKKTKTQIGKDLGVSPSWLWKYVIYDEECKKEMDRMYKNIRKHGETKLASSLEDQINNIILLSQTAQSEHVRLSASVYICDKVMGKATSKVEIEQTISDEDKTAREKFLSLLKVNNIELKSDEYEVKDVDTTMKTQET